MQQEPRDPVPTDLIASQLKSVAPSYSETPLLSLPSLAALLNLRHVFVKNEGERYLGSFKSLGGTYAGLRALAASRGQDLSTFLSQQSSPSSLPLLMTASAGNHGLAVAAAAHFAGSRARIYLYPGVSQQRVRRIEDLGAETVMVDGVYDDAVAAATAAAAKGEGILVADTSDNPADPQVRDVIAGYGVMTAEIRAQFQTNSYALPTHIFVQAGVGGLAAAVVNGLANWMSKEGKLVVVEPTVAACVAKAFEARKSLRIEGSLDTAAAMLACGEASAPAMNSLERYPVEFIDVSESGLLSAPSLLVAHGGPKTTASGAAGLSGLVGSTKDPSSRSKLALNDESCVLLIITEGELEH